MALDAAALLDLIRRHQLLSSARLAAAARLQDPYPGASELAEELVRRGWLTAFQVHRLLKGRADELVLGQYLLLEPLGTGGMGEVYRALHRRLERPVALKLIRPQLLENPQAVERFLREARAAARLSHPNIVLVHDADEVGGIHFLVMELVEGTDLHELVVRKGPLPPAQACDYTRQAALGLQHVHEKGLVHRDIKPSNLLRTSEGVVKVTDLGLAGWRLESGPVDPSWLTGEGAVLGTPDFMAPEQARDARRADIRADLYSLGCSLYFLLASRPPFPGGSLTDKLLRHQQAEPDPIDQLRPGLPSELGSILSALLAKRPEDRPDTPAAAAALLEPLTRMATVAAGAPAKTYQPVIAPTQAEEISVTPAPPPLPPSLMAYRFSTVSAQAAIVTHPPSEPVPAPGLPHVRSRLRPASRRAMILLAALALVLAGLAPFLLRQGQPEEESPSAGPSPAGRSPVGPVPVFPAISAADHFDWQPPELAGLLGEHRWRTWSDVLSLAVSPDGKVVAAGGVGRQVVLLDAATGTHQGAIEDPGGLTRAVAFDSRGQRLACSQDARIRIWDVPGRRVLATLEGHQDNINGLAFHPDGKRLFSAGDDRTVRVWDLTASKEMVPLPAGRHPAQVTALALSPDGKRLASASNDRKIRLWQVDTGQQPAVLPADEDRIISLAFSPDGNILAWSGKSGTLRLWEVPAGKERPPLGKHASDVTSLAFSSDGQTVALAASDDQVLLWNIAERRQIGQFECGQIRLRALVFSPTSATTLFTAGESRDVRVWNLNTRQPLPQGPGHRGPVVALAFHPEGRLLASGGEDSLVRLWQLPDGKPIRQVSTDPLRVTSVVFRGDGDLLAATGPEETVLLLDPTSGAERRLGKDLGPLTSLAFSADGRYLAQAAQRKVMQVWNVSEGSQVATLAGHTGYVNAVAFIPGGPLLAAADGDWETDGEVKIWDWAAERRITCLKGHTRAIAALAVAPDGSRLATGDSDGTVRLWDVANRKLQATWKEQQSSPIMALAYSPEGNLLVSSDQNGTVVLRDGESGAPRHHWQLPGCVHSLAFHPAGRHLATGNTNGTIYLFRLPEGLSPPQR